MDSFDPEATYPVTSEPAPSELGPPMASTSTNATDSTTSQTQTQGQPTPTPRTDPQARQQAEAEAWAETQQRVSALPREVQGRILREISAARLSGS